METAEETWCEVGLFRTGRRGFVPLHQLRPAQGPDGVVPMGVDDSRSRARQGDFDARGEVRCAQERGEVLGRCQAMIARGDGGDAVVVVTFPNGFKRGLFFIHGEFVRASATMSGVGRDVDWRLEDGLHVLRVDDQRYELRDSFVFGERDSQ